MKEECGGEVDIESGLVIIEDDSGNTKQGRTLFEKIYTDFVGDSVKGESNMSGVSVDMVKVTTDKLLPGKESVKSVESCLVKEKRKKSGNKKAAKPPRAPRAPSLDAADQKLIREITQLAMLKRARVERMKALKKMKAAKSLSPTPGSGVFSLVLTVLFCIVILLQGMSSSSGKSSVASFQGSPVSAGGAEAGLIAVQLQHHLNPSSIEHRAPSLESHKIVHGSYLPRKLR